MANGVKAMESSQEAWRATHVRPTAVSFLALAPLVAGAETPLAPAAVLLAAGDFADCSSRAAATAKLLDTHPGLVLAVGDLAYPRGSREDFRKWFAPTWGLFRSRMKSVPGNHEHMTAGAQPYFAVLDSIAGGSGKGNCSLDYRGWHVIALNSHIPMNLNSPQAGWLKAEFFQTTARCRVALLHLPGQLHESYTRPSSSARKVSEVAAMRR